MYKVVFLAALFVLLSCENPPREIYTLSYERGTEPKGLDLGGAEFVDDNFSVSFEESENEDGVLLALENSGCLSDHRESLATFASSCQLQSEALSVEALNTYVLVDRFSSAYALHIVSIDEETITFELQFLYDPAA